MIENEMGYRGSKSLLIISKVKEQRVDGSYFSRSSGLRAIFVQLHFLDVKAGEGRGKIS
jgi:hypothetical protein